MPTELIPAPFASKLPYQPMPAMGLSRPMNISGAILPNGVANPWALHNALETCQPVTYPVNNGVGSVIMDGGRYDDGWEGSAGRSHVGYAPDVYSAAVPRYGHGSFQHAPSSYGNHRAMSAASFAMRPRTGSLGSAYSDQFPMFDSPPPRPRWLSVDSDDCQGQCGHYRSAPRFDLSVPKRHSSSSRRRTPREGISPFSSSPLKQQAKLMPAPVRRRSSGRGRCGACERGCNCN